MNFGLGLASFEDHPVLGAGLGDHGAQPRLFWSVANDVQHVVLQDLRTCKGANCRFGHLVGDKTAGKEEMPLAVAGKGRTVAPCVENLWVEADFGERNDFRGVGGREVVDCMLEGCKNGRGAGKCAACIGQVPRNVAQFAQSLAFSFLFFGEGGWPVEVAVERTDHEWLLGASRDIAGQGRAHRGDAVDEIELPCFKIGAKHCQRLSFEDHIRQPGHHLVRGPGHLIAAPQKLGKTIHAGRDPLVVDIPYAIGDFTGLFDIRAIAHMGDDGGVGHVGQGTGIFVPHDWQRRPFRVAVLCQDQDASLRHRAVSFRAW